MNGPKKGLQKEERTRKDSELFRTLVRSSERYLKDYTEGRQDDDEKAKVALRVLSVYRRILKIEKERAKIRAEWTNLLTSIAELRRPKKGQKKQPKKPLKSSAGASTAKRANKRR
jgi:hypothetical protein